MSSGEHPRIKFFILRLKHELSLSSSKSVVSINFYPISNRFEILDTSGINEELFKNYGSANSFLKTLQCFPQCTSEWVLPGAIKSKNRSHGNSFFFDHQLGGRFGNPIRF